MCRNNCDGKTSPTKVPTSIWLLSDTANADKKIAVLIVLNFSLFITTRIRQLPINPRNTINILVMKGIKVSCSICTSMCDGINSYNLTKRHTNCKNIKIQKYLEACASVPKEILYNITVSLRNIIMMNKKDKHLDES